MSFESRRIYVASSWRNLLQPGIVGMLRSAGHEVYDFKNPRPGNDGFHWSEVDPAWKEWTVPRYIESLQHRIAQDGFALDWHAMEWADTCVLVLPSGRSAHLEAGYFVGADKHLTILVPNGEPFEPELMYLMAKQVVTSPHELLDVLGCREV